MFNRPNVPPSQPAAGFPAQPQYGQPPAPGQYQPQAPAPGQYAPPPQPQYAPPPQPPYAPPSGQPQQPQYPPQSQPFQGYAPQAPAQQPPAQQMGLQGGRPMFAPPAQTQGYRPPVQAGLVFGNLATAKPKMGSNYDRPGLYWMRINKVKLDTNRKNEINFVVEKTVVRVLDDDAGRGHRLGEDTVAISNAKHDSFQGNVKQFLSAAFPDVPPEQIDANMAEQICGPNQPMTGMVLEMQAKHISTKSGGVFTDKTYRRVVPVQELLAVLSPQEQATFFPNGALQRMMQGAGQ